MKHFQLTIVFCLTCILLHAQSSDYKKILEEKFQGTEDEFYDNLQAYQKLNAQFSNVYFQLGEVELGLFSQLDPIVDRSGSRQFIHNAKTNFGLSKSFLDVKEAVKTPEWYNIQKIKEKDSLAANIERHVSGKYQSMLDYSEAYEKLIMHYDLAVINYLEARQEFIRINNSANSLRELFLLADDSLKQAVNQVGLNFDSCIYNLDLYRSTYRLLPHDHKREVNVNLQKINHFRMNGITPSNFLADDIDMWNYGAWSKQFSELLKEEVDGLKKEVEEAYTFFLATNERMMLGDECIQANLDDLKLQRIINLVTKYDNQSVLIDIFTYLTNKLEYGNQLVFERNCNEIEGLPTDDLLSRKVRTFQTIYNDLIKTDSVSKLITNTTKNQQNFGWFFDEHMPGSNGSSTFANKQIEENNSAFTSEINKFRALRNIQYLKTDSIGDCFQLQDSLLIADPVNPTGESICIIKKLLVEETFEIGLLIKNDIYSIAGLDKEAPDYKIIWEQPMKSPVTFFKVLTDSSFIYGGQSGKTWLKHVYTNGEEKSSFSIKNSNPIQNIYYNDLQGIYTVVTGSYNDETKAGYTLSTYDFNGKLKANKVLNMPGEFINLFITNQKYWIFSKSEGEIGSLLTATVLNSSLAPETEPLNYPFINDITSPLVIKNDDKTITVIGNNLENESELIYALIDYQGNIEHEKKY